MNILGSSNGPIRYVVTKTVRDGMVRGRQRIIIKRYLES